MSANPAPYPADSFDPSHTGGPTSVELMPAKMITLAMASGALTVAVAAWFVLSPLDEGETRSSVHIAMAAIVIVGAIAGYVIGRRATPLQPDNPQPRTTAVRTLMSSTILAAAVAESGMLVWLALCFAQGIDRTLAVAVIAVGVVGVLVAAWPGLSRRRALARSLERHGVHSMLADPAPPRPQL